jgi:putative sigma-54 modulation protein
MQVEYTGRQVTITKALRSQAEEGIGRIAKILGKTFKAHVILTSEKYRNAAEVTVKTRLQSLVGASESTSMETALREALTRTETQAVRLKNRIRAKKRLPKDDKDVVEPALVRPRRAARIPAMAAVAEDHAVTAKATTNGNSHARSVLPVTVHSFPAKVPIHEPHVVRSNDSVALRPMTLEEAVKEAEFRDRDVFVFRDNEGKVKVLHRKRDGKMELIEAP